MKTRICLSRNAILVFGVLLLNASLFVFGQAQSLTKVLNETATQNINEWLMYYSKNHLSLYYQYANPSGAGFFPVKKGVLVYIDGLIWVGKVRDGRQPALRAGGSFYRSGVQAGWIIKDGSSDHLPQAVSPEDPRARIFRWRKDFFEVDDRQLKEEVALLMSIPTDSVTNEQADTLRQQYLKDLREWPAELGAPYYDRNRNGRYDPDYDEPGILGADQLLWYVVNDAAPYKTITLFGSMPIGLEIQVTSWAYKIGLSSVVFRRYRVINKSGFPIDSMFVSQFVDSDLGDYGDDLVGCDSTLSYGYTYNGYAHDKIFDRLNMAPPAFGIVLLQGPVVPESGAVAVQDFKTLADFRNLPMTSFWYEGSGDGFSIPNMGVYDGTLSVFANLQGYASIMGNTLIPFKKYINGKFVSNSPWPLTGNPVTGEGDIDGKDGNLIPGARKFMINSGPFNMQPGDVQDIIFAYVAAYSSEGYLDALANLEKMVPTTHKAYQEFLNFEQPVGPREVVKNEEPDSGGVDYFILAEGYPNPFVQNVKIKFRLLNNLTVRLDIFNSAGQRVKTIFRGSLGKGDHELQWDGTNNTGVLMPSGVYFVRLKHGPLMRWQKVILLK
ncbi:MAG: T9SS type A sorting domain-containing protein [Calditrichaeota bacterium]|nr:T9SS type A sorting domain-containing protein [Calditrichota bacterium]